MRLSEVLNQELATIKELTDFEKGLKFAIQRMTELISIKFEYLANPYYQDFVSVEVPILNDLEEELDMLT